VWRTLSSHRPPIAHSKLTIGSGRRRAGFTVQVREPVWRWGLGAALIDSDGIAVGAVLVSLLIDGAGVFALVFLVKLARNWRRHRRARVSGAL
jgi:hypothetical protein